MNTVSRTLSSHRSRAFQRFLIGLQLGLCLNSNPGRAESTLDSIVSTTNGVRLAWTNSATNQAYTVQVRDALTSGAWRNAPTRYRWPSPLTHWSDAPRNLPGARFYRVVSEPVATPSRGKFLRSSFQGQWDASTQNSTYGGWGIASFARAKFGIISRSFTYETIDPHGLSITASALLILPMGTNGPLPLVSVHHGTTPRMVDAPSQPGSGEIWASVLGSYGYAVVVPDYLGLGSSPGYQAYLHARSEATCVVDALRAGRALCSSNHVSLDGQLFLTGFSQGGHVTMAAHRELETFHTSVVLLGRVWLTPAPWLERSPFSGVSGSSPTFPARSRIASWCRERAAPCTAPPPKLTAAASSGSGPTAADSPH